MNTGFENAETVCFDFLRGVLSATHDADSFRAELPVKGMQIDVRRGIWMFALGNESGDAPLDYDFNYTTPGGGGTQPIEKLPAQFQGWWQARPDAIRAADLIRQATPIVQGSLDGVYRFRRRNVPVIERVVIKVAPDQTAGGVARMWQLRIPMEVWYYE
jgi:hypothetical protein